MESEVQKKLIKQLEDAGYYVIKLQKTNKNGIPDLLVLPASSDAFFIEVKTMGGVLSELQKYRHDELRKHGIRVDVHRG